MGKALIRRMQPPTLASDNSPHNTFRPREKEQKQIRRTRKNDKDAHKKIKLIHADFQRCVCVYTGSVTEEADIGEYGVCYK